MPFDAATLAIRLAAGGTSEDELEPDLALAHQLACQELGREADGPTAGGIIGGLENGLLISEVRAALRGSYERMIDDHVIAGQNSDAYRRLSAYASVNAVDASPTDVAECIAVYRLVLGREPEPQGFVTFVGHRREQSLAVVVRDIAGSNEAVLNFAPEEAPTVASLLPAIGLVTGQVLHAMASDTTLGSVIEIGADLEVLMKRVEKLEGKLERFMEIVLLRLDAQATTA